MFCKQRDRVIRSGASLESAEQTRHHHSHHDHLKLFCILFALAFFISSIFIVLSDIEKWLVTFNGFCFKLKWRWRGRKRGNSGAIKRKNYCFCRFGLGNYSDMWWKVLHLFHELEEVDWIIFYEEWCITFGLLLWNWLRVGVVGEAATDWGKFNEIHSKRALEP